jgi:GNAT superfamily N-acetyltransferase
MERLVKGLADFENEPESVHVTKEQYRRDGFTSGQSPLFHCLLLEDPSSETITGEKNEQKPYVCGMGFTYFGFSFGEGRFLYLEDLYIDKEYRGKGGGSMMMQVLKEVAQSTNCVRSVWQALDWNTPALTFYNKIGGRVQDGLITSRYASDDLQQFHSTRDAF